MKKIGEFQIYKLDQFDLIKLEKSVNCYFNPLKSSNIYCKKRNTIKNKICKHSICNDAIQSLLFVCVKKKQWVKNGQKLYI